jgi:DNA-binding GntR family transcriptional regulator
MSSRDRNPRRSGVSARGPASRAPLAPHPALAPIDVTPSFKHKAYTALKNAIVAMDIYRSRDDIRLDERKLAQDFGISRTPVREAAWAALESMAARLITQTASDDEIAGLRKMFATFENGKLRAHLDEYSDVNIEFHQTIIRLSRNDVLIDLAENLFTHMRMIRRTTIGEQDRADRSIRDHMNIIEALEARATDRAEELVRDHALGLADHVSRYADYLD